MYVLQVCCFVFLIIYWHKHRQKQKEKKKEKNYVGRGAPLRIEGWCRCIEDFPSASWNHPQEWLYCHQKSSLQGLSSFFFLLIFLGCQVLVFLLFVMNLNLGIRWSDLWWVVFCFYHNWMYMYVNGVLFYSFYMLFSEFIGACKILSSEFYWRLRNIEFQLWMLMESSYLLCRFDFGD